MDSDLVTNKWIWSGHGIKNKKGGKKRSKHTERREKEFKSGALGSSLFLSLQSRHYEPCLWSSLTGRGALLYRTVSHAFMGCFDTTALLFRARSFLSLLSSAIWCGGDQCTKTDRESERLKEEGKKKNQEKADETDLCSVWKGQVGKLGLQSERVKGGHGRSVGVDVLGIWNFSEISIQLFPVRGRLCLFSKYGA